MFSAYTKLILQDYTQKREKNELHMALIHLKPAGLRDLCLAEYQKRYDRKKDEIALTGFFGNHDDKTMAREIKRCEPSKFKPLIRYLNKETQDTDEKNIEILAWLIDFEPRPFELRKKYEEELITTDVIETGTNDATNEILFGNTNHTSDAGIDDTPPEKDDQEEDSPVLSSTPKPTPPPPNIIKLIGVTVAITGILSLGLYYYNTNKQETMKMGSPLPGGEACMYWQEDHYTRIPCHQKIKDALVIALDTIKLAHFKKITTPDTLTQKDAGRVWYTKTGGEIEFYTSDGFHPVDIKRRLKPATAYIIDKYILSQTN